MLTFDKVIFYLSKLGIDYYEHYSRSKIINICCPFAKWTHPAGQDKSPSCSIWYRLDGETTFKCWSCGEYGAFWQLVQKLHYYTEKPEYEDLYKYLFENDQLRLIDKLYVATNKEIIHVTSDGATKFKLNEERLKSFCSALDHPDAEGYLKSRKKVVPKEIIEKYEILYDYRNQRIAFPVRDCKGTFLGVVGRPIIGASRYHNYFGFDSYSWLGGLQFINPHMKGIIVVEGFFDVLGIAEYAQKYDLGVLCTFKAKLSDGQAETLLSFDKKLYFFYDLDHAGISGAEESIKRIKTYSSCPIYRATWDDTSKDPGDFLEKDFNLALSSCLS